MLSQREREKKKTVQYPRRPCTQVAQIFVPLDIKGRGQNTDAVQKFLNRRVGRGETKRKRSGRERDEKRWTQRRRLEKI